MPTTQNKIIEFVKKRKSVSEASMSKDVNRVSRYYNLYRGRQTFKNYNGLAKLFIPEPHRIVARKTAKIVNSIKSIEVTPQEEKDIDAAKTGKVLANFLNKKLNLKNFYRTWVKESRITGLSWAKITWDVDREEKNKPWQGFNIDQYSMDRVFINPKKTMLDIFRGNLDYLILEYEADMDTLNKNNNYDKTELKLLEKQGSQDLTETALSQSRDIFLRGRSDVNSELNKTHVIKEYWGRYEDDDWLFVIADDRFILRQTINPYKDILDNPIPFIPMVASLEPFEVMPIGDIEPNESLFNELNDTRNQRMDTVTFNIDPVKIIQRSAKIDKSQLVPKRGWFIESSVPNAIQFIPPDMQGVRAAIEEEKIIRGDIQQSTGILDFAQSSNVQSGIGIDTAKGALIAKGEADVVTEDEIEIAKVSLAMFWRIMMAYAQNFLDRKFTIRLVQDGVEEFHNISKSEIQGNLDIDVEIETLQDRTTRQQLSLLLFNISKDVPGAKLGKFFTDLLMEFKDNIEISEYYEQPGQSAPPAPSISVSLKGEDLHAFQVDEIYKLIPGVDPAFADPALRKLGRDIMEGKLPEALDESKTQSEIDKNTADAQKSTSETVNNLTEDNDKNS